ncbi:S1/P1 nuclease [Lojkania enalia]|uniref:S1/P1 nuclease n=1 Tax=Lojkania enalia TaxID=147567 RepID=A0A9P4TPM5_9PLEO|nr:S1/P1 nuclease [Didymosphaeria enalia]
MKPWKIPHFFACVLPLCDAWGNLAHRTIALLAQKHFTPEAAEFTRDLLGKESIDSAAIWADTYKLFPWGRKTASWHFVDAQDEPPNACSVDYHRDCQPNRTCIITAIIDMTDKVIDITEVRKERKKALKFLLHLMGDLHCPLHAESIARGGNDIPVLYHGKSTNLHFTWDVLMPQDIAEGKGLKETEVALHWAEKLYSRTFTTSAGHGKNWSSEAATLILGWAKGANALVCRVVLKDGVEAIEGKELSGKYFQDSVEALEYQIALSGFRLAMWIHSLARSSANMPEERDELR